MSSAAIFCDIFLDLEVIHVFQLLVVEFQLLVIDHADNGSLKNTHFHITLFAANNKFGEIRFDISSELSACRTDVFM